MLAVEAWPDVILALGALCSAVAGLLAAWAALRRTRSEVKADAEEECLKRLQEAWKEAEGAASRLHQERMRGWEDETPS